MDAVGRSGQATGGRPRSSGRVVAEVVAVAAVVETVRWALAPLVLGGLFFHLLAPVTDLFSARLEQGQIAWGGTEAVPIAVLVVIAAAIEGGSPWQLARRLGLVQPVSAILGPVASLAPLLGAVALAAGPLNRAVPTWASAPHLAAVLLSGFFTALLYQGYGNGRLQRATGWPWARSGAVVTAIGVLVALPLHLRPRLGPGGPRLSVLVLSAVFGLVLIAGLSAVFAASGGNVFACTAAAFVWLLVIAAPAPGRLAVLAGGAVSAAALAAVVSATARKRAERAATPA
jgi:hypothetical protein